MCTYNNTTTTYVLTYKQMNECRAQKLNYYPGRLDIGWKVVKRCPRSRSRSRSRRTWSEVEHQWNGEWLWLPEINEIINSLIVQLSGLSCVRLDFQKANEMKKHLITYFSNYSLCTRHFSHLCNTCFSIYLAMFALHSTKLRSKTLFSK